MPSPTKKTKSKFFQFLINPNQKTPRIYEGLFEQLSSLIIWWVMLLQSNGEESGSWRS